MTEPLPSPPPKRRRHLARKWHRWLGLVAAFPLLWLAISGVLLNHAESLGLNDRLVTNAWVLNHYHQIPEGKPYAFKVGDRVVAEWGGELFLDEKPLPLFGDLVGVTAYQGQLLIATPEKIGVFDGADEMLLELDDLSLPKTPVQAIGVKDGRVHFAAGDQFYFLSKDFFSAEETTEKILVTHPKELSGEDEEALVEALRSRRGMPLSRVILDAHSGSLFGWPGWIITDLAAVGLVVLTLLGMRLFPKRKSVKG